MKYLLRNLDWFVAGTAVAFPAFVLGVDGSSVTLGDLLPLVPLYVIAWRMKP